jgi:hypothetical protein
MPQRHLGCIDRLQLQERNAFAELDTFDIGQ